MEKYYKMALFLSYFTVGYNILEGIVSIIAGLIAGSIAIIGFGIDSFVESLSGCIMIWRFRKHGLVSEVQEEIIDKRAMRYVGVTLILLGLYVAYESLTRLYHAEIPDTSVVGIGIAVLSICVMPVLYMQKIKVGKAIGSKSLMADAKQTLGCLLLSAALLIGLSVHYFTGWWQADPIFGLVIAIILVREGVEIVKGDDD